MNWFPESPLIVPCTPRALGPLGDLQGTSPGRLVSGGDIDKFKNVPTNLSVLKSKVDKLDVDKLVALPVDLSKLSDVVKVMLLKEMYIMLKSKIYDIRNN